jgi:glycosyltransferase involved in cell wall biosynthesis
MSANQSRHGTPERFPDDATNLRGAADPAFSIIIPTYNRAAFIGRAVESVLCQTRPGDEVIVVDDGSGDDTPRILERFGDRIIVIRGPRGGAGRARNLGVRRARNELVAFLDSDDEWLPGKLDLQRAFMSSRPDVLYCFSNFQVADREGRIHHGYLVRWPREHRTWEEALGPGRSFSSLAPLPAGARDFPVYICDLERWQLTGFYVLTDTLVVRREQAGDALHFAEDLPTYEDLECFIRLARRGPAAFLDVDTARQRDHDGERLSRFDVLNKLDARIRLIGQLWGTDEAFLAQHGALYRRTLAELEEQRIRALLVGGKNQQAREILARLDRPPWQLRLLARLPASLSLRALQLRRAVRQAREEGLAALARSAQPDSRPMQPEPAP